HQMEAYSNVNFTRTGALPSEIASAKAALKIEGELIVASPSKPSSDIVVSEFYLPVFVCCNACLCVFVRNPPSCLVPRFQVYSILPDSRPCAFPLCGGYFYSSVNEDVTVCMDGTTAVRCYAASVIGYVVGPNPAIVNASATIYSPKHPTIAS